MTASASDGSAFVYDLSGNMTSVSGPLGSRTLVYDDENRSTTITYPGGTDTFVWNALGQRMRATFWGPGCVRRYFYDGQRVLEETNDAGGIYARYIAEGRSYYDPLLLFARCSGEVRYPLYDGIGTTQRLVDQNGTVTDSYTIDAFGKPFSSTGTTRNPYRYGGAWDYFTDYLGSGLLQLGHRFYWPEIGRFIQQDAAGDGVNWYAYVDDNPVTGIDPEGLLKGGGEWYGWPWKVAGLGSGGYAGYHKGELFGYGRLGAGFGGGASVEPNGGAPGYGSYRPCDNVPLRGGFILGASGEISATVWRWKFGYDFGEAGFRQGWDTRGQRVPYRRKRGWICGANPNVLDLRHFGLGLTANIGIDFGGYLNLKKLPF